MLYSPFPYNPMTGKYVVHMTNLIHESLSCEATQKPFPL